MKLAINTRQSTISTIHRSLPTGNPGRSSTDLELATRMLELLRRGSDLRMGHIAAARDADGDGTLDQPAYINAALDRLLDDIGIELD